MTNIKFHYDPSSQKMKLFHVDNRQLENTDKWTNKTITTDICNVVSKSEYKIYLKCQCFEGICVTKK